MKIIAAIRYETDQVIAAKKGTLSQLRAPAFVYDPESSGRKATPWGKAKPGDLFWLGERAVYWTANGGCSTQHQLVFKADHEHGFATAPQWIAARHGKRRHEISPEKLPKAWSKRCLLITATRLERLNSISSLDAHACGVQMTIFDKRPVYRMHGDMRCQGKEPRDAFLAWWTRTYGEISATSNPEVAALDFTLIEEHADTYLDRCKADTGAARIADEAIGESAV